MADGSRLWQMVAARGEHVCLVIFKLVIEIDNLIDLFIYVNSIRITWLVNYKNINNDNNPRGISEPP